MEEVASLTAQASKAYAFKNWEDAANTYSDALEKLADINGEENSELLFLYGRALYQVALSKSAVLGQVPDERPASIESEKTAPADPRFSFQGDDALEEDDDAGYEDEEQQEDTNAEDDFQNAWEALDLARISFQKKLSAKEDKSIQTEIRKRLADTHDLLGEISLENENFDQAVGDLKTALLLKQDLYEQISSQVSGAHYMLALALEYCTSDSSRKEATSEVESAIASFEGRLQTLDKSDKKYKEDVEMLGELRLKLKELKAPKEVISSDVVKDLLGGSEAVLKDSLVKAMQSSNDLTTLVRKKEKKRPAEVKSEQGNSQGKRVKMQDTSNGATHDADTNTKAEKEEETQASNAK